MTMTLLDRVRASVIGDGEVMQGPYGPRRITYADHTASGRALHLVEDVIRGHVLPWYANTHSESSATAAQTTRFREEAREIIHRAVGGTDEHVVIFTGSGCTGAVNKLAAVLGLTPGSVAAGPPPVVFVGPYEHHSNELPWRESAAEVVATPTDPAGRVDLAALAAALRAYADRPLKIGTFSAASNVTGALSDVDAVAALLHAYGAYSFWDYAAAGPYLPIRVGASAPGRDDHKDAVFLSPHKFAGGPQTPGVLVVRKELMRNRIPTVPGGGVITYVNAVGQWYVDDPVMREEGGTPAIVESIRAGIVFALKESIGTPVIAEIDDQYTRRALNRWRENPYLELLGNLDDPRLPIISFRVRAGQRYLHHHLVVALLNDLFGIQARGGCSCAGPYGHSLLGIGPQRSDAIREQVERGYLGVKPGWARITLNYAMPESTVDYIIEAVDLIGRYGYRLLGDYVFDPPSGHWHHRRAAPHPPAGLTDLLDFSPIATGTGTAPLVAETALYEGYLNSARAVLAGTIPPTDADTSGLPPELEALREYHLPPTCLPTPVPA